MKDVTKTTATTIAMISSMVWHTFSIGFHELSEWLIVHVLMEFSNANTRRSSFVCIQQSMRLHSLCVGWIFSLSDFNVVFRNFSLHFVWCQFECEKTSKVLFIPKNCWLSLCRGQDSFVLSKFIRINVERVRMAMECYFGDLLSLECLARCRGSHNHLDEPLIFANEFLNRRKF